MSEDAQHIVRNEPSIFVYMEKLLLMTALWLGAFAVITILDEGGKTDLRMWTIKY